MKGVNKAIIVGTVVKDPSIRQAKDVSVANFTLATNFKETATYHDCVAFGAVVDNFLSKYVHKGSRLYVEGRLQNSSYEKDFGDGQKHKVWKTQIVAVTIELVYTPDSVEATSEDVATSTPMIKHITNFDDLEDDIPF